MNPTLLPLFHVDMWMNVYIIIYVIKHKEMYKAIAQTAFATKNSHVQQKGQVCV